MLQTGAGVQVLLLCVYVCVCMCVCVSVCSRGVCVFTEWLWSHVQVMGDTVHEFQLHNHLLFDINGRDGVLSENTEMN